MIDANKINDVLKKTREQSPLVHNITNLVVMNNTANALLSIGASPVMAHESDEMEDMVSIASALVINMGTLSKRWVEAMIIAGKKATERGIPVVFDPVGVGATAYRSEVAQQIIEECKPTIITGNASEIMALSNENVESKGVDSSVSSNVALDSAKLLAKSTNAVIVVTGEIDYITDGVKVTTISNGSSMMPRVTGLGCSATAITAAFAGVEDDLILACASAMAVMGVAGEMSSELAKGPGSLQMHFLDQLYNLTGEDIEKRLKIGNE